MICVLYLPVLGRSFTTLYHSLPITFKEIQPSISPNPINSTHKTRKPRFFDNIPASKAVKQKKSMVFLPAVNKKIYCSPQSGCSYQHKENLKTHLAVFANIVLILLDVSLLVYDRKPSLFVYNMQLNIQQRL